MGEATEFTLFLTYFYHHKIEKFGFIQILREEMAES
jgi:hypothetical protein